MSLAAAQLREKEIERAWLAYQPERAKVPSSARRATRAFTAMCAASDARLKEVYKLPTFHALLDSWWRRGSLRPERLKAANRIAAALAPLSKVGEPISVNAEADGILLLWSSAHDGLVEVALPTYKQPGVVVAAARWRRSAPRGERVRVFPLLEVPEHALGRMFQRCPGIGAAGALVGASRAFLAADYEAIEAARLRGATVCLPCGRGLLLCQAIKGPDLENRLRLIVRANTFVSATMAARDQRPPAPAAEFEKSVLAAAVRGG